MDIYHYLELLLVPITSVVTWAAARRKRRNDAIVEMQKTIDMLVQKNGTMYQELIETRKELAEARTEISTLKSNQEQLLSEKRELIELLEKNAKK